MVLKIRYFFRNFVPSSLLLRPFQVKTTHRVFLAEFSESEVEITLSDVFRTYSENIDFGYRLLISFQRMIRPSNYALKYHFGPKMLEYDQKNFFVSRFQQLVFVMTSPL